MTSPSPALSSNNEMACGYAGSNTHIDPKGSGQQLENILLLISSIWLVACWGDFLCSHL